MKLGVRKIRESVLETRAVRVLIALALLAAGLAGLAESGRAEAAQAGENVARIIELDGAIDNVAARYIKRGLESAASGGVGLVIIELDTPGGLLDATRTIVTDLFASQVPVVVYVAPEGAQAASAGTFIAAAASKLAMAPATNIGAASVVGPGGEDLPETLQKKANQDAAAFLRSIADRRDRPGDALEAAVFEAAAYSAEESVELGIADLIAANTGDLLSQLDGTEVEVSDGKTVTLQTTGMVIERVDMNVIERALSFLANPNIAFLLISIGGIALIVEIWNIGLWIPGTIGVILLLLGFAGVGHLPFSWAGVGLMALAMVLFLLEAQAPGVGYFGAAGTVCLILGGIFLVGFFGTPELPGPQIGVSRWLLFSVGAVAGLVVLWFANEIRRSRRDDRYVSPVAHGRIIGMDAVVEVRLAPTGEVRVAGETWTAELEGQGAAEIGEKVVVSRREDIKLYVARPEQEQTVNHAEADHS